MVSARSGCFIFYDMGNRRERESIQITRERGASGEEGHESMHVYWMMGHTDCMIGRDIGLLGLFDLAGAWMGRRM